MSGRGLRHRAGLRHWAGFVLAGGTAFLTDAGVTLGLVHGLGLDRYSGRALAILAAMVVAWAMHRRFTFAVATAPSLREFARFATVAAGANGLNYGLYAAILLAWPQTPLLAALTIATAIATLAAYLGFRFKVFGK